MALVQYALPADMDYDKIFQAPDTYDDPFSKYSLRLWWIVIQAHKTKPYKFRKNLYERALKHIPNCYKLWFNYLKESLEDLKMEKTYLSRKFKIVMNLFENAMVYMHKMPNLWLMFAEFSQSQNYITKTRQIYDRALMSLPITQHHRIWKRYCQWVSQTKALKTASSVFSRYLKINQDYKEEYLDFLVGMSQWDLASQVIEQILNDEAYTSAAGKTKFDFLSQLCDIISLHPKEIKSINCAGIIQHGITKYSDEIGTLWIRFADYYIKLGLFEKARDTFEDALNSVLTVRDFGQIFNSYVKFEESVISLLSNDEDSEEEDDIDDVELAKKLDKLLKIKSEDEEQIRTEDEIELKLFRLEQLLERRPLLLNSCLLRQNSQNVQEWLNRIKIVYNDERMIMKTFKEAIETLIPEKVENGKLSDIWLQYGKYYKNKGDYKMCNQVLQKGTLVLYRTLDEFINLWTQWAEMLLEDGYYEDSIKVLKQALFRKTPRDPEKKQAIDHVPLSVQLWQLYIDLERNFGTFQTVRAAYKRMMELKVITPFILMNYAQMLEDNQYFEESFKVFEYGISLFTWPNVHEIQQEMILYINKFIQRYKGTKVERTRNLFESALEQCPKDKCRIFYLIYGQFEEEFGLLNHAIEIYDRMVFNVEYKDKLEAYNIYISKVATYLGITKTRAVFESAIENLKEFELIEMGLRFAELERKFGEIDRARQIYMHISQFSDPRYDDQDLWKTWENFELHHGNEDTYKEFRRISKSVLSKFNLMPPDPNKIKERVEKEVQ